MKSGAAPSLSPAQKAAIVLASLPRETAAALVGEIDDRHLATFIRVVSEMKSAPAHARFSIAQEFIAEVLRRKDEMPGGADEANRLLSEIADKARVERVMGAISAGGAEGGDLWRKAAALPAARMVAFLADQRLATAAAVLSNLPAPAAAEILAAAPIELSKGLIAALARIERPDQATTDAIATAIEAELIAAPAPQSETPAVSGAVSDILDLLPGALRDGLINHIGTADESMAAAIRRTLVTYEGFHERLTEVAVAALLRTADRGALLQAIKHGAVNAVAANEFLLANMSKRMAEQLREDLAALPAPAAQDGEAAQRAIVAAVKALEKSGEIKLKPAT